MPRIARLRDSSGREADQTLAVMVGKIAEQLLAKVDDLKWSTFVDIIGRDIKRAFAGSKANIIADFISFPPGVQEADTGTVTHILNIGGVVNDGQGQTIEIVDAVLQVKRSAKPLVIPRASHFKGDFAEGHQEWSRSALLVPVLLQGSVFGILRLCADEKQVFKASHVNYANIIASLIQTFLNTNRQTKLVRMSMQNQGAPRRKKSPKKMEALTEEDA